MLQREVLKLKKYTVLVLLLVLILALVGCETEDTKATLKLNHKLGVDSEYLTDGQEILTKDLDGIKIDLTETEYTNYSDGVLPELVSLINENYPNVLNENWEYMIHFFDEQKTAGTVHFRYVINNEVLTDKGIAFSYENGVIDFVIFSNVNKTVDEDDIITRVSTFKDRYTQEKRKLKNDEEFIEETVQYSYNYCRDKLIYTYNLFFYKGQYELRVVNNDTISEYFIDGSGYAVD